MATVKQEALQPNKSRIHILEQAIRAHIWTHSCMKYADGQQPPLAAGETVRLDGPLAEDSPTCKMLVERLCGYVTTCKSEYEIRVFLSDVIVRRRLGMGFHPDTPFEDYINLDTHENVFTEAEAAEYDRLMNEAFNYIAVTHGVPDIYDLSIQLWNELFHCTVGM